MKDKKLYRNTQGKMIAGVCSGIADYFDIDPTIVRVVAVALAFAGASTAIAYIIAVFVLPEKPTGSA